MNLSSTRLLTNYENPERYIKMITNSLKDTKDNIKWFKGEKDKECMEICIKEYYF
jgi:hypothetical protein